jgi:hypothetical protein
MPGKRGTGETRGKEITKIITNTVEFLLLSIDAGCMQFVRVCQTTESLM